MPLVTANQYDLVPQFSNIGTGFAQGAQIGSQFRQRQLQDEALAADKAKQAQISQFSQAALGGDKSALGSLAGVDPQRANQLQTFLSGVKEDEALELNRENKVLTQTAIEALGLPEDQVRPYLMQKREEFVADGRDVSNIDRALAADDKTMIQMTKMQAIQGKELSDQFDFLYPQTKMQPLQKAEGGMVFDPNTGAFSVDPVAKERLDEIARIKESGNKEIDAKTRQSISKDITGMIKDTVGIRNTAEDLDRLGSLGSGPASIAMVYKFMKSLDPASVVREGEFATAESAAGVPAQIANFYNKLVKGERLDDAQIESFVVTAKELANSAIDSSNTEINKYLDTFEDSIPSSFIEKTKTRIPARFDIGGGEVNIDDLVNKYGN